ncbi:MULTISPECIES: TadE/TadG family type IV pilus assembly protein [unclassified Sphingomonas]|uniref:TadE/TadG family type IV pilus assembly protein n=1 Tax=unclassified Sphingomonas TaxID=196159 RepID=UPI00285B52D1|nr:MULTISPECIES: TadE/TadG family type IV pilus assembly protein [unclassified Sphingomonas]MDR6113847.1 Flp pilus assembly protein TadG [Sphingomonas sp. SORGH_AS_0789]MDR6148793.1 Flp pilus assembly protein TadG [Sphingomonas sp. SORGH_AS_0742]
MILRPPSLRRARARRSVLSDRRGAAIVEFALVAAPFLALLLAILQTSLAYLAQESLETAVEVAARGIVTGQTQSADIKSLAQGMTQAQLAERFRKSGCAQLPIFLSCSRLYVDVKSAPGGGLAIAPLDLRLDANDKLSAPLSYSLGEQGAVVIVRFVYVWPMRITPQPDLSGNAGSSILMATSVSKSEPYT